MNNDKVISTLTAFHGIGFKTGRLRAAVFSAAGVFPVITHIHRICNRLGLSKRRPRSNVEAMKPLVPKGKSYSFHTNLIRFGRTVCLAQRPRCNQCPLYDGCVFPEKENLRPRKARLLRAETQTSCFWMNLTGHDPR